MKLFIKLCIILLEKKNVFTIIYKDILFACRGENGPMKALEIQFGLYLKKYWTKIKCSVIIYDVAAKATLK